MAAGPENENPVPKEREREGGGGKVTVLPRGQHAGLTGSVPTSVKRAQNTLDCEARKQK